MFADTLQCQGNNRNACPGRLAAPLMGETAETEDTRHPTFLQLLSATPGLSDVQERENAQVMMSHGRDSRDRGTRHPTSSSSSPPHLASIMIKKERMPWGPSSNALSGLLLSSERRGHMLPNIPPAPLGHTWPQ